MITDSLVNRRNTLAALGLILTLPALVIVSFGLMEEIGFPGPNNRLFDMVHTYPFPKGAFDIFFHPVVVLSGLFVTLALNVLLIVRFKIQAEEASITAFLTLKERRWNAVIVACTLFLSGAIMTYAFVENFQIVPR